jgi:hypothetical protein
MEEYLNDTANESKPKGFDHIVEAVERLGKQNGTATRLVWMPEVRRFLWGSVRRYYAFKKKAVHIGWEVGRYDEFQGGLIFVKERTVPASAYRLEPGGAHRLHNGKWIKPRFDYDEIAYPRWAIEERLPDSERVAHNDNRYEYFADTNEFVDALGEYPKEGKWACIHVVAAHGYICCKRATQEGRFCYGTRRNPTDEDVQEVQQRIQARDSRRRIHSASDFEQEHKRLVKQTMEGMAAGAARQKSLYKDIIGEEIDTVFDMEKIRRQHIEPVNRVESGTKRIRLVDNYGRELPVTNQGA